MFTSRKKEIVNKMGQQGDRLKITDKCIEVNSWFYQTKGLTPYSVVSTHMFVQGTPLKAEYKVRSVEGEHTVLVWEDPEYGDLKMEFK